MIEDNKEEEKYERKDENNLNIIQINNDDEKEEKNKCDNKVNKNYKINNININNHNENKIDKYHHSQKISLNDATRISNSIWIISVPTNEGEISGTCFFMYIISKKYLLTNCHIIPEKLIKAKKYIRLENNVGDKFFINLNREKRNIIYINKPYDIVALEILESDNITNILYLDYDNDNVNNMEKYMNKGVFILQHPKKKNVYIAGGTIERINLDIYEFDHTVDTDHGSSGSPVFLNENFKIIGIHKKKIRGSVNKKGTFIFKLIEKIINQSKITPNLMKINKVNEIFCNDINEIENNVLILKYKLDLNNQILIFSNNFFKNNKNIFIKYSNEKEYKLISTNFIKKDEIEILQNQIEIKLKILSPINKMENMFNNCTYLTSVRFINFDTSKVITMFNLFAGCNNLTEIFGIDKFDTSMVKDIKKLFSGCTSLINLPKALIWNTKKVDKMDELFSGCESLTEIPDISKWNTINVISMKGLFKNCKSLRTIPDIHYWDTGNVKNMSHMFFNCEKLETLPNISFWDINSVETLSNIFSNCISLKSIPDISKWNTSNVKSMNNLFLNCQSVKVFPNILKWNTKNVNNMNCMFSNCINAESLPNVFELNTKRVKNKKLLKIKKKKYDKEDE